MLRPLAPRDDPPVLIIEIRHRHRFVDLGELWTFREVVFFLVWRNFKVRYRQTILGVAWALLQPLLTVAVFTLIFSRLANVQSEGVAYPLFVLAGLVPWQFFSQGISAATMGMVTNQDLIRRVYFPRVAVPLSGILSGLVDLGIGLLLLTAAFLVYGHALQPSLLLLPFFLLLSVVGTLGVGLILSAANVQYRDVGYAVPFGLQIALFLSPIAYPSSVLPQGWRLLYSLNPMVGVVDGIRWSLFGTPIDPLSLVVSTCSALGVLVLGGFYFRHVERVLADVL